MICRPGWPSTTPSNPSWSLNWKQDLKSEAATVGARPVMIVRPTTGGAQMISAHDIQSNAPAPAPLAAIPIDDGWVWVLKAAAGTALAVAGLQLLGLFNLVWGIGFGNLRVFSGGLRFSKDVKDLLQLAWIVVHLAQTVCLGVAGYRVLRRRAHGRRWILIAAVFGAVDKLSLVVITHLYLHDYLSRRGWAEVLYQYAQQAIHLASELWLPVLLTVVATRPAVKQMLDGAPGTGAFETLPASNAAAPHPHANP
jgi:hypothetical protein